ncbi:MAG TPA: tetratricopeptide repeat protein [Sphingomicrobium sp.]
MAQPPDITETFVREVDENLRRDRARDFFKTYGNWLIAAVVLFLAVSGGLIWWNQHRVAKRGEQVEQLAQVYRDIGSGNVSNAGSQLDALSDSGSKGVRASAKFARAALALQQNDTKQAAGIYKSISEDSGLPQPYRDAALVRQTALEFDQLQPDAIITRLAPLTKPGEPWFGSAGEMTALAMIKQGKTQQAAQLFATIAKDKTVPETLRARAAQIAGTMGVDVTAALEGQAQ